MEPTLTLEYYDLKWFNSPIFYQGMVGIRTEGDGSCFFHAISKAISNEYKNGVFDKYIFDRKKFIKDFREHLASHLPKYYYQLSRGQLPELAKDLPELSLENMQNELNSNLPVDNRYNEYISEMLSIDLYILDGKKQTVYKTGKDSDILYKNRESVVILYSNHHYELVGVIENDTVTTIFEPTHPFIMLLRKYI